MSHTFDPYIITLKFHTSKSYMRFPLSESNRLNVKSSRVYLLPTHEESSQRTHKYFINSFFIIAVKNHVKGDFIFFNAFIYPTFQGLCHRSPKILLEVCNLSLNLALRTGATDWMKRIVGAWITCKQTNSSLQTSTSK
jgi:hypothetical protein